MEYHVPQFIEVESRVVGPLTLRQFIYLAGTAGLCVLLFVYLQAIFAVLCSLPVAVFGIALAFYKVNGKPFVNVLEAGFNYYTGAKLFLWKHQESNVRGASTAAAKAAAEATVHASPGTAKLTRGKLSELAWSLDIRSPESRIRNPE